MWWKRRQHCDVTLFLLLGHSYPYICRTPFAFVGSHWWCRANLEDGWGVKIGIHPSKLDILRSELDTFETKRNAFQIKTNAFRSNPTVDIEYVLEFIMIKVFNKLLHLKGQENLWPLWTVEQVKRTTVKPLALDRGWIWRENHSYKFQLKVIGVFPTGDRVSPKKVNTASKIFILFYSLWRFEKRL